MKPAKATDLGQFCLYAHVGATHRTPTLPRSTVILDCSRLSKRVKGFFQGDGTKRYLDFIPRRR